MKIGWVGFCIQLSAISIYLLVYLSANFLWLVSVHRVLIRLFKSNLASIKNKWISTGGINVEVNCTCNNGYVFSNSLKMCWMKESEWRIKNEHCSLGEHLYDCRIKGFEFFFHLYNWQCDSREVTWTLQVFSSVQ